jgi:hypothetical protein
MYLILGGAVVCFGLSVLFFLLNTVFSSGNVSDENLIETIQIDAKIMPTHTTYRNMQEMQFIVNNNISELADDYIDTSRIDAGDRFFYYENTASYFPTLYFDQDHIPVGNSTVYCVFLKFIEKELKRYKDQYRDF